jgi:hypothetical protein
MLGRMTTNACLKTLLCAAGMAGKWTFKKYYYEPEFKAGNFGMEDCTQR